MITCTKCGNENPESSRYCSKCGNKLQSGFIRVNRNIDQNSDLSRFKLNLERPQIYQKHGEAWVYALFLLAAVFYFTYKQVYWPLYVITPLIALLAWLRKL
ncbi:zinc-ribbon domain-containing protein [Maridesulfovibrio bastinii]|uniref:zinc-ribbon domain-containing protein n=1 Tax=Maridesulfovibrio bastinii TaxID=47157 RepID=UPI0004010F16|nr:zinc ribbon domain-containing protein [Maridesulfovibrio bastinii]